MELRQSGAQDVQCRTQVHSSARRSYYSVLSRGGVQRQVPKGQADFSHILREQQETETDAGEDGQESVDHSLLEPISGLLEEHYAGSPMLSESMSYADVLVAAKQLEQIMQKFYGDAGEKVSFIATVSRLYKRYALERSKALATLQGLS